MQFRAIEYFRASLERMRQARGVFNLDASYALAIYGSGLAVECMARAFRWLKDQSFEGRHDLELLFEASGLVGIDEAYVRSRKGSTEDVLEARADLEAWLLEVDRVWHNNLRFCSEACLKSHLKRLRLDRGVKKNPERKVASAVLEAAGQFIDRGTVLWKFETKS